MGKKRAEDPPPNGAPMWIVTFTDMISLLLTFFILMLTFSSTETDKFNQVAGSLNGSFGSLTQNKNAKPDQVSSVGVANREKTLDGPTQSDLRDDPVSDALDKVQNTKIFNTKIEAQDMTEGTRLRLEPENDEEFFELGTTIVTPKGKELLGELATMFRTLPCRLVVETHVDALTWRASGLKSSDELTLAQGIAASRIIEGNGVTPERIGVSPRGDHVPLNKNSTAEERYANRRIEILVLPDNKDELLVKRQN